MKKEMYTKYIEFKIMYTLYTLCNNENTIIILQ